MKLLSSFIAGTSQPLWALRKSSGENKKKVSFFFFFSMTVELNAMMHATHASSSSCCSTLVLLSSYELEAEASSFICHVMFMMRYTHHFCRTVGSWQRHCRGAVVFPWEIWKGWNGAYSLSLFFFFCFAWSGILLLLMSFSFSFSFPISIPPYFSSHMDWLLRS